MILHVDKVLAARKAFSLGLGVHVKPERGFIVYFRIGFGVTWLLQTRNGYLTSLRNKSCKSLGSRSKRSRKSCYTNWTIK